MKIYMVRHGMPQGAEKGRRYLGLTDEPLCKEGKRQADNAGQLIAGLVSSEKIRLASSTLRRSIQTAKIINEHIGCNYVEIDDELREIDLGVWDGKYAEDIRESCPEEYEARGRDLLNYRIPEGETFAEAGERFKDAVNEIVRWASDDEVFVIVAHAGVIRAGLSLMTDTSFEEWMKADIPYTCVIVLSGADRGNGEIRLEVERIFG